MNISIETDNSLPQEFHPQILKKNQPVNIDEFYKELLELMEFNISWTEVKPCQYAEVIQNSLQSTAQDWENLTHKVILIEILDEKGNSFFNPHNVTDEINNKTLLVITSELFYLIGFKPQGQDNEPTYEVITISTSSDVEAVANTLNYYPVDENFWEA